MSKTFQICKLIAISFTISTFVIVKETPQYRNVQTNAQLNKPATQLFNGAAKFDLRELSIARFWAFPGDAYSLGLRLVQAQKVNKNLQFLSRNNSEMQPESIYKSYYGNRVQCLPLSVVQLIHCQTHHCCNGVASNIKIKMQQIYFDW